MNLTTKEKADRYDSLQTAIKWTIEQYRKRAEEDEKKSDIGSGSKTLDIYRVGYAQGIKQAMADMKQWV